MKTRFRVVGAVAILIIGAHVALVLYYFPSRHASSVDPLASGDLSFYLGSALEVSNGRAEGGGLYGYSPYSMAGYPYGTWISLGRRGYEITASFLPFGDSFSRFYVWVIFSAALPPLILGAAIYRLSDRRWQALWGTAFAVLIYHLCDPVVYFWTFGNVGFPLASALTVLVAANLLPREPNPAFSRAVFTGLLAGVTLWIHVLAVVPLFFTIVAAVTLARRHGWSWKGIVVHLVVFAAVVTAVTLPGHVHYFRHLDQRVPMAIKPLESGVRYLFMDLLDDRAYRHPMDRRTLFHVLLVLGTWQGILDWRERRFGIPLMWSAGMLTLGYAYAAPYIPFFSETQPYRFVASAELFLTVPAFFGSLRLVGALREANPSGRLAFAVCFLALLPGLTGSLWDIKSRARASGLSLDKQSCIGWVRQHPSTGRILCEPGDLGNLLPHLTHREVIGGGTSTQAVVPQRWANADRQRAFGKSLEEITTDEFLRAFRLLDIRLCIIESDELFHKISSLPVPVHEEVRIGELRILRVDAGTAADIWSGCYQDQVTATHNRIRITNPPHAKFTINYHYVSGFQVPPGATIAPKRMDNLPAPFIEIENDSNDKVIELVFNP
jgi:hypothetical protein